VRQLKKEVIAMKANIFAWLFLVLLFTAFTAQAKKLVPVPTEAQILWADSVNKNPSASAEDKAKAKLIIDRVSASVDPVCNLPEKTDDVAFCAAPGDFSAKDRGECIKSATVGAARIDANNAINAILKARAATKNLSHGVATLPERPTSVVMCLMGEFSTADRQPCCNKLGLGSVLCTYASEVDEASRDHAHKPVCL
jgi:hypothetical protein